VERSGIVKSRKEFGLGLAGLMLITLAAIRLGLQPGAVSLLYLIDPKVAALVYIAAFAADTGESGEAHPESARGSARPTDSAAAGWSSIPRSHQVRCRLCR
jgi:hypothetical protein